MSGAVAIVDYGSGNLRSAAKAFERMAAEDGTHARVEVTADPACVAAADRVVLPGVGAFRDCAEGVAAVAGMREALERHVASGRPFLGICVGMQLMARRGLEHGETPGFGWVAGEVRRIEPSDASLKIPHMGWNALRLAGAHPLLEGVGEGDHAYFVHSYHLAGGEDVLAHVDHGGPVTAMVARDNMAGTQFHPEKSQATGLRIIASFLRWAP